MKILRLMLVCSLVVFMSGVSYSADVAEEDTDSSEDSGNQALTGAVLGGLLGAGLGAGIGSAVGRAGTGAAIGGGVGAVGGTLVGASQQDKQSRVRKSSQGEAQVPKDAKIKKKVMREYDDKGNLISETEVKE